MADNESQQNSFRSFKVTYAAGAAFSSAAILQLLGMEVDKAKQSSELVFALYMFAIALPLNICSYLKTEWEPEKFSVGRHEGLLYGYSQGFVVIGVLSLISHMSLGAAIVFGIMVLIGAFFLKRESEDTQSDSPVPLAYDDNISQADRL